MSYLSIRTTLIAAVAAAFLALAPAAMADGVYFSSPAQDNTYYSSIDDVPSVNWSIIGSILDADCEFERVTPSPTVLTSNDCFTPGTNVPVVDNSMAPASFGFAWNVKPMISGDGTYRVDGYAGFLSIEPSNFSITFTLDTVDPTVTASAPLGWTTDSTPSVGYTLVDANPGTTYCSVDPADPNNKANYTACPSTSFSLPALADGSHTFWVLSEDLAGNVSTASKSFDVDATAPDITVTGLVNGQVLENAFAQVNVSYLDTGSGNGSLSCAWDAASLGSCSSADFSGTIFADGAHTLTVVATDTLGNARTLTINFTVDTTAGIKQGLIAPKTAKFKVKRGKLKGSTFAATVTSTFAIPAGGDAKSCSGTAATRVMLKKKQLGSGKIKFKAAAGKCTATSAVKIAKKFKGKKLTFILDYKNGPIKAFRVSGTLKF